MARLIRQHKRRKKITELATQEFYHGCHHRTGGGAQLVLVVKSRDHRFTLYLREREARNLHRFIEHAIIDRGRGAASAPDPDPLFVFSDDERGKEETFITPGACWDTAEELADELEEKKAAPWIPELNPPDGEQKTT